MQSLYAPCHAPKILNFPPMNKAFVTLTIQTENACKTGQRSFIYVWKLTLLLPRLVLNEMVMDFHEIMNFSMSKEKEHLLWKRSIKYDSYPLQHHVFLRRCAAKRNKIQNNVNNLSGLREKNIRLKIFDEKNVGTYLAQKPIIFQTDRKASLQFIGSSLNPN